MRILDKITQLLHSGKQLEKIRNGETLTPHDRISLIVSLSVPSMLAQISSVLMFFIDASMVGHLGARASASIGLVEPAGWLFGSLTGAASIGFSVQVAHAVGASDWERMRRIVRCAFASALLFSLVLMAVASVIAGPLPHWLGGGTSIQADASAYFLIFALAAPFFMLENLSSAVLKASGDMHHPSAAAIMLCVLDVVFNYLFIYVLGLGVKGAALGSDMAFVITVFVLLYYVQKRLRPGFRRRGDYFSADILKEAVKISTPMALQYCLMNGAQIVSTMIVAPLGNIAISAHSFAITAESLCYMPGYGIGDAASTLCGQTWGAGRKRLCRSFARMTIGAGMLVMTLMGLIMYLLAPEMIRLLTPVADICTLGAQVLRIEAFAEPFFAASIVTYSVCVALGDTLRPAALNLVSMWCVRLTLAWWLSQQYGLVGVWTAMALELSFRGLSFLGYFHYRSRKVLV